MGMPAVRKEIPAWIDDDIVVYENSHRVRCIQQVSRKHVVTSQTQPQLLMRVVVHYDASRGLTALRHVPESVRVQISGHGAGSPTVDMGDPNGLVSWAQQERNARFFAG
jgi:hypothetical protein